MFLQNCLRIPGYPKISNFGYPIPEITENTQPYRHTNGSLQFVVNKMKKTQIKALEVTFADRQPYFCILCAWGENGDATTRVIF